MNESQWPLSPRAARVFYGIADAWIPPREDAPGGGDLDVVAALASQLRSSRERRALSRTLWLLEWSPRLLLRSLRGLAWMEREERRCWLARLERSRFELVARQVAGVRECVDRSYAAAQSLPGA